jgi:DNA topoisomerase-1
MPRLRRVDCAGPGITRVRRGRGFSYLDEGGERIDDPDVLARIDSLVIPPAWRDVWICVDPLGHIQATGVDDRGRKQYRYHDRWRARRDAQKFEAMIAFARALPALRREVTRDLARPELDRRRALALAVRLLDIGFFRIGTEDYAQRNESYGLATMRKDHASIEGGAVVFDYPAKSGQRRVQSIADPDVLELVAKLKRRRGGGSELLAYRDNGRWRDVKSDDVNAYLRELTDGDFSAKDFRTWNATVLAAIALATNGRDAASKTARKRAITAAVKGVAFYLGNTPAVCRASYVDPRVIDRYEGGLTIAERLAEIAEPGEEDTPSDVDVPRKVEAAVLDLIAGDEDAPGVEEVAAATG